MPKPEPSADPRTFSALRLGIFATQSRNPTLLNLLWLLLSLLVGPVVLRAASEEYVDPQACRSCHARIYDSYRKTAMGRSFYLPATTSLIEDWEANNSFYHEPSDRYYEMTRRVGKMYVRRHQLDHKGRQVNVLEKQVTHIMGSGERARSYLHQSADGRIIELPVSWYSQEKRWAMAPGYDRPKHAGFTRAVNYKCMFCHNGYPAVPPETARQGWDHDPKFPGELPLGIDCQRCHGPGAAHVREATQARPPQAIQEAIVNPARLTSERQLEVCMQCHLETTSFRLPETYRRFGRSFYSYRPGEPLGDYIIHFDHAPGTGHDDKFEIVSAAYRLRQSACFKQSGEKLLCTTCHDPHAQVPAAERQQHYRERCLSCHSTGDAPKHDLAPVEFQIANCIDCHMPLQRTEDVVHVAMTDHRIPRHKPDRDLLAPLREKTDEEQTYRGEVVLYYPSNGFDPNLRNVYLGIAQVKEAAKLERGVDLLQGALARAAVPSPEPYHELAEALVKLNKPKAARRNYLRAIEVDPAFVQAHHNLANLLADMGRSDEAIKHYRKALELDPHDASTHTNLGLVFVEQGRQEEAEQAFRAAVKANPMSAQAHLNLGSTLLVQGRFPEAAAALGRALAIEPDNAKAHNNLGLALLGLGRRDEAIAYLQKALKEGDSGVKASAKKALELIGAL